MGFLDSFCNDCKQLLPKSKMVFFKNPGLYFEGPHLRHNRTYNLDYFLQHLFQNCHVTSATQQLCGCKGYPDCYTIDVALAQMKHKSGFANKNSQITNHIIQ